MKNKETFIVIGGLVLAIVAILIFKAFSIKEYSKNFFYMDTYINVKVYTTKERASKAFEGIEDIYKTYHNLTDKFNSHEYGLYDLNHGKNTIDYRLYKIIEYGYSWYDKTDGLLNIAIGNLSDIWKSYISKGTGLPSKDELNKANINISDVIINETKTDIETKKISDSIKLKHGVTIDLGAIAKGYTTDLVGEYLKNNKIDKFIINAGGNVLVGNAYKKDAFKIGIEDPTGSGQIFKVINGKNIAVVTSGGYHRNYEYNGKTYNHIINPNTKYPADKMLSVTVIAKTSKEADALSTSLFLMDVEKGMEFIKDYDADAIWYLNDGTVITTDGIKNYE